MPYRQSVVSILGILCLVLVNICFSFPLRGNKSIGCIIERNLPNPGRNGTLCVAFISCNRPEYLRRTLEVFYRHIRTYERNLTLKTVWIDQATPGKDEFARKYKFDLRVFYSHKMGYPRSFQTAFEQCEDSKYFLALEEDWLIFPSVKEDFLSKAIDVLDHVEYKMYGVRFKWSFKPGRRIVVKTRHHQRVNLFEELAGCPFSNVPTLYRMQNIKDLLAVDTYVHRGSEDAFSEIVREKGFYYAFPFGNETTPCPKRWPGYFEHIGQKSRAQANDKITSVYV